MQELRFVGVEQGDVIATSPDGVRYRLVVDAALREALRPRSEPRAGGPKVPPRIIQQLIRAGRTVEEVVADTGAEHELVARFEGPILAERGYIVEQARAVSVRIHHAVDPLVGEGATFGDAIDERLEQLGATDVRWDAWKDPDTGWHVGLDFVASEVTRNALWSFDAKTRTLQAISPAAITLSQQGELPPLGGPHLRAIDPQRTTGVVIPAPERPRADDPFAEAEAQRITANETADLLEELRRRRGERSALLTDEEELVDLGDDEGFTLDSWRAERTEESDAPTNGADEHSNVTPLLRPAETSEAEHDDAVHAAPEHADPEHADPEATSDTLTASDGAGAGESTAPGGPTADAAAGRRGDRRSLTGEVPLDGLESPDSTRPGRRRGGRPSMPSWDEIVFGTKTDD